ncbi:chorion class B protein PC10-like [Battus philenor]|uniref:chorion class B protein PC10-like n=1 Tax=Battus philenor TaxID=42288 RepID=UPI0035CED944
MFARETAHRVLAFNNCQTISAFCNRLGAGLAYEAPLMAAAPFGAATWAGYGAGCGLTAVPTSSGGGFTVSSASPIPPDGLSVLSENEIGGILAVGGEVPFLGTVGLEGALPTAGAGAVSYGCGDGAVGMISEDIPAVAWGYPVAGLGYGPVTPLVSAMAPPSPATPSEAAD